MFIWIPSWAAGPENAADCPSKMDLAVTPGTCPNAGKLSKPASVVKWIRIVRSSIRLPLPLIVDQRLPGGVLTPQRRGKATKVPESSLFSEELLDLVHPGLRARVVALGVLLADRLEFAQQLPLLLGQIDRSLDDDVAQQIALFPAAHAANAFAAQPEYLSRLGLGGDPDPCRTVQRRDFDVSAEGRRREADRHLAMQVVVVALEHGVRLDLDLHVEVACRTAVHPGLAFSREANAVAVVDSRRNFHGERFLLLYARGAVAARAGFRDDFSGPVTVRARLLDGEKSLLHAYLAVPFAGRAGSRLGSGLGARALAGFAIFVRRNSNPGFGAARRLLQRDLEVVAQVGPAVYRGAAAARLVEDVAEDIAERVGEARESRAGARHARLRIDSGVPITVIGGALVGVGQDLVRLFCFLEMLFGPGVVRVSIRVMLHREAPIGLLDRLLVRVAVDAQHFVVIPLRHRSALSLLDAQRPS